MKIKAITVSVAAICASLFALQCLGQNSNVVADEVHKAASESLKTYRLHGLAGLKGSVAECWIQPRDFCLYLDVAAQRIAATQARRDTPVDKYFFTSASLERALAWLSLNARSPVSNVQYLYAVEQMMDIVLSAQQEKAIYTGQ